MPDLPARLLGLASALAAGFHLTGAAAAAPRLEHVDSWAAFYGAQASVASLQRPDLLVLEPDHPWKPESFRRSGQRVLAYLSLGEVHKTRPYYAALERARALAGPNPDWPGAVRLDPRAEAWRNLVLGTIAPAILQKGYDGFFLDTLDVAAHLERQGKHPGATAAMAKLVTDLHARFPQAVIVANGGIDLLPAAAGALSAVAVESIYTDYDFAGRRYRPRDPDGARERAEWLMAKAAPHGLPLLVLEYVDPAAAESRKAVAAQVRKAGFVPFVSDIALERLDPTP